MVEIKISGWLSQSTQGLRWIQVRQKKRSEKPENAQHALGVRDRISNWAGRKGRAEIGKKLVVGSEVDGSVSNTTSQEKPVLDSGFKPPIFCEILFFRSGSSFDNWIRIQIHLNWIQLDLDLKQCLSDFKYCS